VIKILHLITTLSTGGAEINLYKLLASFDREKFSHTVVCMTKTGSVGKKIESLGVPVISLSMRRGIPTPLAILNLMRILRNKKPKILSTWLYHADLLGLIAGKMTGVPKVVWNIRCGYMDMARYSVLSLLVVKVLAKLSAYPNMVIANSCAGVKNHESLGYHPGKWEVVHNGFDTDLLRPDEAKRKNIRKELGISGDVFLIGMVGRYDHMKDHETFLKAAGNISKTDGNVKFILAGPGVDEKNSDLLSIIKNLELDGRVILLGERDDIPSIMTSLDIYTLSSRGEGFPNVVGEAMACGVVCVVTDVGDAGAIVADTGVVVPPENPTALADGWRKVISMGPDEISVMGAKARGRIEKKYKLSMAVEKYQDIYLRLS